MLTSALIREVQDIANLLSKGGSNGDKGKMPSYKLVIFKRRKRVWESQILGSRRSPQTVMYQVTYGECETRLWFGSIHCGYPLTHKKLDEERG